MKLFLNAHLPNQTTQTKALTQEESYSQPNSDEREQRKITPGTGLTDLTGEFERLTQRLKSSNRKELKPRRETRPANEPAYQQRNQLATKFEQLAERLRADLPRDPESNELPRTGVESQTPKKSNKSTEPNRAHQRQNQQDLYSSDPDREAAKPVNTTDTQSKSSSPSTVESPSITSTGQSDTAQLTDAQLIRAFKAVRQWQDNSPTQPNLAVGKRLKKRAAQEAFRKEQLTIELKAHRQILDENKPRSFLNPFGIPDDLYRELQTKLEDISREIRRQELQLTNASNDFQKWQKETRAYLAWLEDPQTLEMRELASRLESSAIEERLQFLGVGYAIYEAAQSILAHLGQPGNDCRYHIGKSYRIEQRGLTITITDKERSEPLYVATDSRKTGGIISTSQFNLTNRDKETVIGCAEYLEEQQQKQLEIERHLGEELEP